MNLCILGRVFRIVLGLTLIGLSVFSLVGAWGWLGLLPLTAGVMNWCPVNKLFGLKECNVDFRRTA